jgi:hypothetical protein
MSGRILIVTSLAALLSVAPALAGQSSQQPVYKPPSGQSGQSQGETNKGGMSATQPGEAVDETKKIQQNTQSVPSTNEQTEQQQSGNVDQTKKIQQGQQSDQMTTGSTSKVTEVPAEKKTVIREKIVTNDVERIQRNNLHVNLSVGVIVPTTIKLRPLPSDVVEVVPAYKGYLYFVLDDGTIVIVEPGTMQIAAVLSA